MDLVSMEGKEDENLFGRMTYIELTHRVCALYYVCIMFDLISF
jgi:hypothetical protein